jgi:hypothetical protein
MVAGAIAFGCIAVLYGVRVVPDGVVSLLGGPAGGVDRWGGLRVRYKPPANTDAQVEDYLAGRARIERRGDALLLEFPGVAADTADDLIDALIAGGLAMREVHEDEWAVRIAHENELVDPLDASDPDASPDRVRLEQDYWQADDGSIHRTYFLSGPTREALDAAIALARSRGYQPGTDREILYEQFEPLPEQRTRRIEWRAYMLSKAVPIDGTMISAAYGSYEPNTGRPIVLLDFTSEGADVFCELTQRIVGNKLATVLGGRIRSAPIINSAICGGRASITMGGSDPEYQLRERDMLIEVLRHGGLPTGGTIEDRTWMPPANARTQELLGRLLLGLLAGLGTALVVFAALRFARPSVARPPAFTGSFPWIRLLVTASAPIALIAGHHLTIPGVNDVEWEHLHRGADDHGASVLVLGLMPIIAAFVLVELVALAVPPLRWRRHDPLGRVRLGQAVAILAIVLALAQGLFLATYLEGAGPYAMLVDFPGWKFRIIAMLSITAGTLLLAIVAGLISEHGLGNGYGVVIATGIGLELVPDTYFVDPFSVEFVFCVCTFVAMIAAAMFVLRWRVANAREPALRIPLSGLSPLADSGPFITAFVVMTGFSFGLDFFRLLGWADTLGSWKVRLVLIALTIPIWAWVYARPAVLERAALQAGLDRPTRETWLRGVALTALLLFGVAALSTFATRSLTREPVPDALYQFLALFLNPVSALLFGAVLLDLIADARARSANLAVAGVVHQVQYLGVIERVLDAASIPHHAHASHLRTLLAFFGPFAPVIILVPDEHAMVARLELDEVLRAARTTVPAARAV